MPEGPPDPLRRGAFPLAQWLSALSILLPLRGQHQIFTDFPYTNNCLFGGGMIEGFPEGGKRPLGRLLRGKEISLVLFAQIRPIHPHILFLLTDVVAHQGGGAFIVGFLRQRKQGTLFADHGLV